MSNRAKKFENNIRQFEPMSRHSSWRCGGVADFFFQPQRVDELSSFLREKNDCVEIIWLGLGSNLLVRDGGFKGFVVSTTKALRETIWGDENKSLYVQAGVSCAKVAKEAAARNRKGLEFLVGIPGTIGGALRMNAGALGFEIWDFVEEVETIDPLGNIKVQKKTEFTPCYRDVRGPARWFVGAKLRTEENFLGDSFKKLQALLQKRRATQPIGKLSCGSVFTNPSGDFAGRLIETSGLKGCRIGGAVVSEKHANFILNENNASATDIERLILHIQDIVKCKTGVILETEVKIVGNSMSRALETI